MRGHAITLDRVLAIGDSVRTDLAGAHGFGIDCLFVTRGIHSEEFEGVDQLDPALDQGIVRPPAARDDAGIAVVMTDALRSSRRLVQSGRCGLSRRWMPGSSPGMTSWRELALKRRT